MESASNAPDPIRLRTHSPGSYLSSPHSPPPEAVEQLTEQEKIKAWARKAAALSQSDLDLGAIARAEPRLADPSYPDDEVLDAVARNLIAREGF